MNTPARTFARFRDRLRDKPLANAIYRVGVGVVGVVVLGLGILAIPYPGPGWAIVFVGLGILASEFFWARRVLSHVKRRYDKVMDWFGRQGLFVQALGALLTVAVVVATLWLLGAVDWTAELVNIDWPWLNSPLGIGS